MLIVLSMAALCNIPYVFEYHLFRDDINNNITYVPTSLAKVNYWCTIGSCI